MSLNWKASDKTEKHLLTVHWRFEGKETKGMHPMLHRLIFLTMSLGTDLTKDRDGVMKRIKALRKADADLLTLTYGDEADRVEFNVNGEWVPFLTYYPNARKTDHGYEVEIDAAWVDRYWGLWTNASRIPFAKWSKGLERKAKESA